MPSPTRADDPVGIAQRILVLRGQRVLLDADLARLYGVPTSRLNEQVRRNPSRFPEDFAFNLTKQELANLMSQIATSSWGGRRKPPLAFTEHGAIMA
ncbi:MAG: ORF6N domain-containing protein, partial [Pseudomonadota bacterium]|nr:ORF6N domain-containing protein [Pseudomonadota bacterium]